MNEGKIVKNSKKPNTSNTLYNDFKKLEINKGDTILVHSSLSALGWTSGGAVSVIEALIKAVGSEGNIIMPTHTSENSNPSEWENPPVPESWWEIIRNESPPYDLLKTPTRAMGVISETFRKYPEVIRSSHPQSSFAALGPQAEFITNSHQLTPAFGEGSPLEKIIFLNGKIILLGVDHINNTLLHYADWKANYPNKRKIMQGAAINVNGKREWVEFLDLEYDHEDFLDLGIDFEASQPFVSGMVGIGHTKIFSAKKLVEFGKEWFEEYRN